jgi:hypothetical protein
MVRNPHEVIPSMIDMAEEIWKSIINDEASYSIEDKTYEMAMLFYEYPMSRLNQAPKSSFMFINYSDLISHPSRAVQDIYEKFGFEVTSNIKKILKNEEKKAKSYQSRHFYCLDDFSITKKQISMDLDFVFRQFDF